MSGESLNVKRATHPHWSGTLVLDESTGRVSLKEFGSTGEYKLDQRNNILHVFWDEFPAESFKEVNGIYVKMFGAEGEIEFMRNFQIQRLGVRVPGGGANIELRIGTTDVDTFKQVFVANEYNIPSLPLSCKNIIDLGANIGCSAVYFAERYPGAKILAVEPDEDNYRLLFRNAEQFEGRITCVRAAIWSCAQRVHISTHDSGGQALGAWGIRVSGDAASDSVTIQGITMADLLQQLEGDVWVDILKVDIEGAEKELFSGARIDWLQRIGIVIVETHDRFKPGSHEAVCRQLAADFTQLEPHGENFVFRNRAYQDATGKLLPILTDPV